ncbi:helix-turn-helix transcriptional regulator [Fannyhessea vaginae]|uniref:helix-turn-helix domain-containing protein n=1 Tax=Fannyhessea vaginae TaxID=82135 RepID=UPI00336AA755
MNINTIQALRVKKGFTRRELAQQLDVAEATIYKWEKASVKPHLSNLKRLSEVLNVDLSFFDEHYAYLHNED